MSANSSLHKKLRAIILNFFLLPGTFIYYGTFKIWYTEVLTNKYFLLPIKNNIDTIINVVQKRHWFCRFCVGIPMRIAKKIIRLGCLNTLFSIFIFKQRFRHLSPSQVELIPGLLKGKKSAKEKALKLLNDFPTEKISISGEAYCLVDDGTSFVGKKLVLIAHWDPDKIIDPYVAYQCQHFKNQGFCVLLTSASTLSNIPSDWKKFVNAIVYRTCDGYDFTSWKAAFELYPTLYQCSEVVLTNDSYFGPIGSFIPVHKKMDKIHCDFWGLVRCNLCRPHLQSYYLDLHDNVLKHQAFQEFIARVPLSQSREIAISFETSFALWLELHHFQPGAFIPVRPKSQINYTIEYWKELIHEGVPVLKREFFCRKDYYEKIKNWKKECSIKGYPTELIENYIKRRFKKISPLI